MENKTTETKITCPTCNLKDYTSSTESMVNSNRVHADQKTHTVGFSGEKVSTNARTIIAQSEKLSRFDTLLVFWPAIQVVVYGILLLVAAGLIMYIYQTIPSLGIIFGIIIVVIGLSLFNYYRPRFDVAVKAIRMQKLWKKFVYCAHCHTVFIPGTKRTVKVKE
ncbi:MAG TPA: hypothetical protein VN376_04585, partial [Longilinea sp.]|nr:hypothetical protein [Longilinea sp.]